MELKPDAAADASAQLMTLLIVPYGIETTIETIDRCDKPLLIVPYGIETTLCISGDRCRSLLIVPYGIETADVHSCVAFRRTFNRTLWN